VHEYSPTGKDTYRWSPKARIQRLTSKKDKQIPKGLHSIASADDDYDNDDDAIGG
jgi:hypothetical protein